MLHNLIFSHKILTKIDWGQIVFCTNRVTGKVRKATWFPDHKRDVLDITFVDFDELISFTDPVAAARWVSWENNHG